MCFIFAEKKDMANETIDHRQEIRNKYPDAEIRYTYSRYSKGYLYWIEINSITFEGKASSIHEYAWQSAYFKLKEQNLL